MIEPVAPSLGEAWRWNQSMHRGPASERMVASVRLLHEVFPDLDDEDLAEGEEAQALGAYARDIAYEVLAAGAVLN